MSLENESGPTRERDPRDDRFPNYVPTDLVDSVHSRAARQFLDRTRKDMEIAPIEPESVDTKSV
jgi:hypothetical protein